MRTIQPSTGIRDIVDVDDLAGADDTAVLTHGDRVIVSLDPQHAAGLAHLIARNDRLPFTADLEVDWIPVIVQLLVAAAQLRDTPPGALNVPLLGEAS